MRVKVGDERPRPRGPSHLFVVSFHVPYAIANRLVVEAKSLVATVRPNRSARLQAIADGVFGAFHNVGEVVLRLDEHGQRYAVLRAGASERIMRVDVVDLSTFDAFQRRFAVELGAADRPQ